MNHRQSVSALFAVGLLLATAAVAGPPLVCHPFEIGKAASLPWGGAWHTGSASYDVSKLPADTLALLKPDTPVIVRMETLRRAAMYAAANQPAADALFAALIGRAQTAERTGGRDGALALFDAGYLAETYRQAFPVVRSERKGGPAATLPDAAARLDGYSYVVRAIKMRGSDPEMEFAAAVMSSSGTRDQHLQRAASAARDGSLLARNLDTHFAKQWKQLAQANPAQK